MAKLVKLQISGIRSFGPLEEHRGEIKFSSPVTLIVGQNGCGKTTIIEAIRYACTGELPGGTSSNPGHGFVNDPKMLGKASTLGQVKLKILDARGVAVNIVRAMELTQKGATLKFETKNVALKYKTADGDERTMTSRCGDITAECCKVMNVSPSVLSNVIFCHQENSAWPLDEGKKLKEKFDEIFDAEKYNKAIDHMKKISKQMSETNKRTKLELAYKKEKKETVEKDKRRLQEREDKMESLNGEIDLKNEQLDPVKKKIDEICNLEVELGDLQRQLATKEETKKGVIEQQRNLRENLPYEYEGDDAALKNEIGAFQREKDDAVDYIQGLDTRKTKIEVRSREIGDLMNEKQADLGRLEHEKAQHIQKCSKRHELVEKARIELELPPLNDDDPEAVLREMKSNLGERKVKLDGLISEQENEERRLQTAIDEARESHVTVKQTIASKTKEIKEVQRKVDSISHEIEDLTHSSQNFDDVGTQIANIDKTLANLKAIFRETEESQNVESSKREIQRKKEQLEQLESDYRTLQQNDVIEAKVESEKQLIVAKQREVARIRNKHLQSLKTLFDSNVPDKGLKDQVDAIQSREATTVNSLLDRITAQQKKVTTLEAEHKNQSEKVVTLETDLKFKRNKIHQACGGNDFKVTLERVTSKKETLQHNKGQYVSTKVIFEQFLKEFVKDSPCCPVCETNFSQRAPAAQQIARKIRSKIERVPSELNKVEIELRKVDETYNNLQQLTLVNDEVQDIDKTKLPLLKQQLHQIEAKLQSESNELQTLKQSLVEPQKKLEIARLIISDIASLDQNQSDVDKSHKNIQNLESQLITIGSNKSKQEVETEIDSIKSDIAEMETRNETQLKKITTQRERIQRLTQDRINFSAKQMEMQKGLQTVELLAKQKVELCEKIAKLEEEIQDNETNLGFCDTELKMAIRSKDESVTKSKAVIQEEQNQFRKFEKLIHDIEEVHTQINHYISSDKEVKLTETQQILAKFKEQSEKLKETMTTILRAISEKREQQARKDMDLRTLKDNVLLREKMKLEAELQGKIVELKSKIGGYNYKSVYQEKNKLLATKENLDREINSVIGQKNELMIAINELKDELNKPENKKAYKEYISKFYELSIADTALKDLQRYAFNFENALLEFHTAKMVRINKNIRELWRDIYRGNDIDYVEIKTEAVSKTASRRAYNYKVVQVKKGVELDMRGRCSAGQKVLACLIIRIALAETLSTHCGILALDEPTTNLDKDNVQSLSDALSTIVNRRHFEQNFQLLVITHDEEFLNTLTRVQGVDSYYRVSRNEQGFSKIKKEYSR